ncbi:MAG: response regulator transcription factor [Pseudomonadota bacterium]
MRQPISIVIADDHSFTVSGMQSALEKGGVFDVVGVAANGIEAIALVKQHQPQCALLDFSMPGVTGLEALFEARRWAPKTRYALITGHSSPARLNELIDARPDGLFLKSMPEEAIRDALLEMAKGRQQIPDCVKELLNDAKSGQKLTQRELEVLHCISRGLTNGQMAEHLSVSPKTIDSHRTNLMRKMNVHTTATLLLRAMRDGLIDA